MIFSHHLLYSTYIQSYLYSWNWWCDCQLQMTSRQFFKHIIWSFPKRTSATTYASAIGNAAIFKTVTFSSRRLSQMKWNESVRMVRWLRWHCPPDTGFEIRALAVWGQARYLSVTEAPHNTEFYTWMGEKHFCFFQTAKTGNRTPNSSVKGSGANHHPRAPARRLSRLTCCVGRRVGVWTVM